MARVTIVQQAAKGQAEVITQAVEPSGLVESQENPSCKHQHFVNQNPGIERGARCGLSFVASC